MICYPFCIYAILQYKEVHFNIKVGEIQKKMNS